MAIYQGGKILSGGGPSPFSIAEKAGFEGTEAEFNELLANIDEAVTKEELENAINNIPAPDVSGQINEHNIDENAHNDIRQAIENAKESVKNELLNGAGMAYDTLKELGELIDENHDAIDALEIVATSKADKEDLTNHINDKNNPHGVTAEDVGARPDTWMPTLDDVGAIGFKRVLTSEDDMNTLLEDGVYVYSTANPPANAPFANAAVVEVFGSKSTTSQKIQRAYRYAARESAYRSLYSSNWLDWTYVASKDDIPVNYYNYLTATDLLVWAKEQTSSGGFVIDPNVTTNGTPVSGVYLSGFLRVHRNGAWSITLWDGSGDTIRVFENMTVQNEWVGWNEMAASVHTHNAADITTGTLAAARIPSLAASKITSGTLAVARGGTGVTSNPSMLTNLGSTTAASVFAASPRPGVTGTLPIANGGTGATTAAAALTALGAAASSHNHAAGNITSGTLSVARGGTGRSTFTSGCALIGAGTGAITTRAITNTTSASTAISANTNLITSNTLRYALNRTTGPAAADTNYGTAMMRAIYAGTSDMTAGTTALTSGTIYFVYE